MPEFSVQISDIKLALKRRGLNYKLKDRSIEDGSEESLIFIDVLKGRQVCGKIVRSFTEGEVYHWPLLNHENLAPLIDVLYIRDDLNIFLTIDQQITLKNIIHEEDFVYDPRCFDRKRKYARGIFSGLSYLHGKSLCLMNLRDENIVISKLYDRAIITNFSHLVCSRKTTRVKLCVPDVYKAPESEKGEFDAIAAEIWASGALMLDAFLAHMVPWAVIDYKPKRVLDIVDKLSLELLQAANAGSSVSAVDLAKFKAFLKCFFKQNPVIRVTARHASIASFLRPKLHDSMLQLDSLGEIAGRNTNNSSKRMKKGKYDSSSSRHPLHFNDLPQKVLNKQLPSTSESSMEQFFPVNYFDLKQPFKNLNMGLQKSDNLKFPNSEISVPKSPKALGRQNTGEYTAINGLAKKKTGGINSEVAISQGKTSINITNRLKNDNLAKIPFRFSNKSPNPPVTRTTGLHQGNDPFTVTETTTGLQKISKSCQAVNEETSTFTESSYTCYHSKSLSLIKSKMDDASNAISFQLCSNRTCSYSNVKSLPVKQSNVADIQNSDLCLNRLFENSYSVEESENVNKEIKEKASGRIRTCNLRDKTLIKESTRYNHELKTPEVKPIRFPRAMNTPLLLNKPDIREMINKIIFLRKCQISIQLHLRVFISKEFAAKQSRLLSEYQLLLHEENLKMCETLRQKYELKLEDIIKLIRLLNPRVGCLRNQYEDLSPTESLFRYRENRFLETKKTKGNRRVDASDVKNRTDCKVTDTDIPQNGRLRRRYSYCRAIEMPEKSLSGIWDFAGRKNDRKANKEHNEMVFVEENKSNDKLLKSAAKRDKKTLPEHFQEKMGNPIASLIKRENCAEANHDDEDDVDKQSSKKKKKGWKENNNKATGITKKERYKFEFRSKEKEKGKRELKSDEKEKCKKGMKNERNLQILKKLEESKKSFFFSLCPGGRVEEPTPILDTLCETCKLNLEVI